MKNTEEQNTQENKQNKQQDRQEKLQEKQEKRTVKISVRNLVEFILRSGDLDRNRGGWADREAMLAGSRIHRRIQKKRDVGYRAEVPLQYEKNYPLFTLVIEGRADGIETRETEVTVEEIKGVYADVEAMEEPVPVHLAQAKCYAAIWAMQNHLPEISVCMTYVNLDTEKIRQFHEHDTEEELEQWFDNLIDDFYPWAEFRILWAEKRDQSIKDLPFPFAYRPGQRQLAADVYRTIIRRKQIFVEAPTGVGKTMSVVYPAVRAIGEGAAVRIFYLTARTVTGTAAAGAFAILRDRGLSLKTLHLTAREKICAAEDPGDCDPSVCPRAAGHYDRVNRALYEMITDQDDFSRQNIMAQAEKWQVCPHELQLDLAAFADAVICDYNYVFDPNARLKRFFGETSRKEDMVFLIDEAHNLTDRGRDMYSAELSRKDFLAAGRCVRAYEKENSGADLGGLKKAISASSRIMLRYSKACHTLEKISFPGELESSLLHLTAKMEDTLLWLRNRKDREFRRELLDFWFSIQEFLYIAGLIDDSYLVYQRVTEDGDYRLKLFCVNPAVNLQRCLDHGRSTVFFSATLLPVRYYRKLLSGREDDYAVYVPSSFPEENQMVIIGTDVSSIYRRRNASEFSRMASYIRAVTSARHGNYMAFFPSYAMMEAVLAFCISDGNTAENGGEQDQTVYLLQKPGMTEEEREEFLAHFREDNDGTLIGCCVMGGIFSEGIDLTGGRLIGALIVGTGIPQVGPERELLKDYYRGHGEDGFSYAYRYPGMNKVLQAAGRVIRTSDDRGVIVLMDERFTFPEYRRLFPREWKNIRTATVDTVGGMIEDFWKKKE
ncbi:MAG: helicase C-terminal domain-containing protein [Bilifractor sp.]